ncbi:MAG TPA: DNA repair protein RecO [Bacillota bacterium]|nr:DNA repair protein RecO [Bacillota bacterium]HOA35067.1 DNA repair protein RecO [Bacillota bacterium]HOJ84632.1 DNA repair protein RecO [Bacillota bacterium]HOL15978.1 DNA repair protein RecO [Bacillota bacterium]HPZ10914.1 DNA repair protein RecO [Bacillota bacterium]
MPERSYKTDALVLSSRPLGEADRLIELLTWERGKLTAVARGARKVKSRLAAGVDLFTYGHYQLHRGRSLDLITGLEVKEHFTAFREDASLYPFGLFLAELTGRLVRSAEPAPEPCLLLLEGWRLLCDETLVLSGRMLLCRAFELKLMASTGFRPHLEGCLLCDAAEALYFSPSQGGLLCCSCSGGDAARLSAGTAVLARRLLEAPLEQVKMLRPLAVQMRELAAIAAAFRRYHFEIGELRSIQLIKLLNPGSKC